MLSQIARWLGLKLPDPCPPLINCSYDASAHLTEETRSASKSGPRGIIMTVVVSFVVGWMYLLSLTFSIQVHSTWGTRCIVCGEQLVPLH